MDNAQALAQGLPTVPLPAHLSGCGCHGAERGRHLTSCVPAREYDALPLDAHPEFELGRRFQAISWVYPMSVRAEIQVEVDVDPVLYIEEHRDEYDAFVPDWSCEEWEKPYAFLADRVTDACNEMVDMLSFGRGPVARASAHVEDTWSAPRFTAEEGADVLARLSQPVDPNQGVMFGDDQSGEG